MGGHAHGEGAAGLPQVPGQGLVGLQDEGERPGPEGLHEGSGGLGHLGDEPNQVVGVGHEDRRGHLASAPLGGQQPLDGRGVGGVAADAVDGVRGQDDEPACAQVLAGRSERVGAGMSGARGRLRGVAHVPHPATDRVGGGTVRRCGPGRDARPSPDRAAAHPHDPGSFPERAQDDVAPLHDATGHGPAGELVAVGQLELTQDRRDVGLDGLDRDEQLGGALLVGVAAGDESHDLPLAR